MRCDSRNIVLLRKITYAVVQQFTLHFHRDRTERQLDARLDELLEKLARTALPKILDGTPGL